MNFDTPLGREYGQKSGGFNATDDVDTIAREVKRVMNEAKTAVDGMKATTQEHDARILDVEQKMARRGGGGFASASKSLGQQFVDSAAYKGVDGSKNREGLRIRVNFGAEEVKAITSATGSARGLIAPDHRVTDPAMLPWNALTVRDLVAPGTTDSNAVYYPRMTGRTNNAATVAEGALKPESSMAFESVIAPVQTIAHYFLISRQIMDDAPALASSIDAEARSGLKDVEDAQLLFGDGTGTNLLGLTPQATPFVKQWTNTGATALDVLIQAVAQVEAQNFKADGMVLNAVDWRMLQAIKDGMGNYIGNNPFEAAVLQQIWQLPVATTNRMPRGKFLIGPFKTQAQIFDRMEVEVLLSTEDSDNFRRNLVTARCEERLAFTVKRPASFVTGDLNASLAA